MSNNYLDECARLYDITSGVDGVYKDPQNQDMTVFHSNGMVLTLPTAALEGLNKRMQLHIKELEDQFTIANQKFLSAKTSIMKMHWQNKCAALRREINRLSGRND